MRSLPLLLILAACAGPVAPPATLDLQELTTSAPILGEVVRAGQACGVPMSVTALDRAARIEAVAIDYHQRQGGQAGRDTYLRGMAVPSFDTARGGRDRTQWCAGRRAEIERAEAYLSGAPGAGLVARAEALR
jgi:hypothetical protein